MEPELLLIKEFIMTTQATTYLRDLAAQHQFFIGTAVDTRMLNSDETIYREVLQREFNVLVAENAMKFGPLSPSEGQYDWSAADALVDFAEANNMRLRGHTLVWHQQLPSWLASRTWTAPEVQDLLEQHIKTVLGRYRGRIWAWDVVNEAIADAGGYRTDSFWHRHLGPEYIPMAFRWAREADPDAILYYNDYSAEDISPKSDAIYDLVRELKQADVPVDGVGWQMHVSEGWRATAGHRENAARLRALGLELSMTEVDVRLKLPATQAGLEDQAASYREMMELALDTCAALLVWGFTDKYSWIPGFRPGYGAALPFDAEYQPKPAYEAIKRALTGVHQDASTGTAT